MTKPLKEGDRGGQTSSTAENLSSLCNRSLFTQSNPGFVFLQKFSLDAASKADPLQLLESIKKEGVRQEFCINDLGKVVG